VSLEALGNVGDFVGGIAVIITLIYLAMQIRQNNRLVEQSTQVAQAQALREGNPTQTSMLAIAQDAELSEIFRRGLASYHGLSSVEKVRFNLSFGSLISALAMNHAQQITLGILEDPRISTQIESLKGLLGTPGGRDWWEIYSPQYPEAFREYLREHVLTGSSSGPDT